MRKKTKLLVRIVDILALIALAVSLVIHFDGTNKTQIMTSATLEKAIDVSDLSTAQFTYNGIAEIYKDITHKKVKCYMVLCQDLVQVKMRFFPILTSYLQ